MTATERKLDEARYFLEQLEIQFPYFDYILSAFISAARIVPWVMRHEYCKVEGWEKWFSDSTLTEREKELLTKTNNWRLMVAKKDGIKTEFNFLENLVVDDKYYPIIDKLIKEMPVGEVFELNIRLPSEIDTEKEQEDDDSEIVRFQARVKMEKEDSELSRKSLKKVCEEYYLFLKNQVELCSRTFSLD